MENIILLQDGREVVNLCPESNRKLAVVDMKVLERLIEFLPSVYLYTIKGNLCSKINSQKSLEGIVEVMEDEIAFRKSVNIMKEVFTSEVKLGEPVAYVNAEV